MLGSAAIVVVVADTDGAVAVGQYSDLIPEDHRAGDAGLVTAAGFVETGDALRIGRGGVNRLLLGRSIWEVAVEKLLPDYAADPAALTGAVLGEEEAEVLIGDEVQGRVEPQRVAAVTDAAVAVERLLVEAEAQAVHAQVES